MRRSQSQIQYRSVKRNLSINQNNNNLNNIKQPNTPHNIKKNYNSNQKNIPQLNLLKLTKNTLRNKQKQQSKQKLQSQRAYAQSPSILSSNNSLKLKSRRSLLSITQAIQNHIEKRLDVQIIVHYLQYEKQYYTKCKKLQSYLFTQPPLTKDKYLNSSNPHFKYAVQFLMLDLFRKGIIVAESYDNMRKQAVQAIQNWMLGWIERQYKNQSLQKQERQQLNSVLNVLQDMDKYIEQIQIQQSPF